MKQVTPTFPTIRRPRDYADPRFEVPDLAELTYPPATHVLARENMQRLNELRIMEHERRLQQQVDEEGCGAVIGACLVEMWGRMEREAEAPPDDITERLRERLKLKYIAESRTGEDVQLVPLADIHDAIREIETLRGRRP